MQGQRYWVEAGKFSVDLNDSSAMKVIEENKKFDDGLVRLTTGELGTEVKWHVQSPCYASLFSTLEWLNTAKLPIILRFYVSGLFEEFHRTHESAVRRLEDVISRGDRHFTAKTMVRQFALNEKPLTTLLNECINKPTTASEYAIECSFENNTEQFTVQKIGLKSVINQVWGPFPSSFPCQATGQYGQVVSEAYREVLNTGRPRYDHVLAAMRMPDNMLFWVPYHRLVLPKRGNDGAPSVLVISELNQVDITLI